MAWYQPGQNDSIWTNDGIINWRIYASLSLNELARYKYPLCTYNGHNSLSKNPDILQDVFIFLQVLGGGVLT